MAYVSNTGRRTVLGATGFWYADLVVEDDIKIASFIMKGLKAAGYAVDHSAMEKRAFIWLNSTLRHSHH